MFSNTNNVHGLLHYLEENNETESKYGALFSASDYIGHRAKLPPVRSGIHMDLRFHVLGNPDH